MVVASTQQPFSALEEPLGGLILMYKTDYELYVVSILFANNDMVCTHTHTYTYILNKRIPSEYVEYVCITSACIRVYFFI